MAAQLDYGYSTPKGVPGGKFDLANDEVVTRMNEEENGEMKFGMAVMVGAAPGTGVKIPVEGTTASQIEGVVLHHPNTEHDLEGKVIIKKGVSLGIMRKGHIWGRTASDAVPAYGATAYVVVSGDDAGNFTEKADGNVDIGAKFGAHIDDGIAIIELR